MARFYARLVRAGRMEVGEVPARWRDEVAALVAADGEGA